MVSQTIKCRWNKNTDISWPLSRKINRQYCHVPRVLTASRMLTMATNISSRVDKFIQQSNNRLVFYKIFYMTVHSALPQGHLLVQIVTAAAISLHRMDRLFTLSNEATDSSGLFWE